MQLFAAQSLRQRQSLVVTAQLQQAIVLLQMGNSDLQSFIEAQAEENPFLELGRPQGQLAPLVGGPLAGRSSARAGADDFDQIAALAEESPSIYAHATAEIDRLDLTEKQRRIAEYFLEALEPSGWLGQPVEEIAWTAACTMAEAETVLGELHKVEPAGLFARNLAECLRLQAADQGLLTPLFAAVLDHLPMLAAADLNGLARVCHCGQPELRAVLRQLRGLNPKPGAIFDSEPVTQRAPDLIVRRGPEGWQVDLNRSTLPSVIVRNGTSAGPVEKQTDAARYVSERVSMARWLARAVEHRNQTTLKVGAEIVRRQQEFLEHGVSHLRPMILREVADAIGVHESTVSRVCSGIMMATPQGTYPLKYFFTAALSRRDGEEPGSAGAVRHRIRQLIQAEPAHDPLSDDTIAKIMSDEGVTLARRTVAKYREQLKIGSSTQRRRQAMVSGQM